MPGAPAGKQERLGAVSQSPARQVYQPEMARLLLPQKWIPRLGSSNPYLGETEEGFSLFGSVSRDQNQVKAIANL